MKKFYIMIGNIGSGKSTYIKDKLSEATVISKDGIRYALGGGTYVFNYKLEPIVHSTTVHLSKELCNIGINDLVLDETNVTQKNRAQWIKIAKDCGYEVIAIELPSFCKEVCVNRRLSNPHNQNNRELWENVWQRFFDKYQESTLAEGFDKIIHVKADKVM